MYPQISHKEMGTGYFLLGLLEKQPVPIFYPTFEQDAL